MTCESKNFVCTFMSESVNVVAFLISTGIDLQDTGPSWLIAFCPVSVSVRLMKVIFGGKSCFVIMEVFYFNRAGIFSEVVVGIFVYYFSFM